MTQEQEGDQEDHELPARVPSWMKPFPEIRQGPAIQLMKSSIPTKIPSGYSAESEVSDPEYVLSLFFIGPIEHTSQIYD